MKLVFASHNKNKIREMQSMLPPNIEMLSLESIGCFEEIPETADTIEGNAILKATYVTQNYGYNCFADDTGLEVQVLDGAPGVYSARYAGEQKNADNNMDKLLVTLENESNRNAQFKTVICLNLDGNQHLFTGIITGEIITEKIGDEGFGYDPIFKPKGHSLTFAQMPMADKAKLSHRGIAAAKLIDFLSFD
jgi:XTP/dITP diphosphohydrolase